ncbi:hypothetical protein N340_12038, partial [Tauraco erythrolophus]
FAFSLPSINREAPAKRFEWLNLPQGMKNSPTLCQLYVSQALQPVREKMTDALIYHYMDDILIARQQPVSDQELQLIQVMLKQYGLILAPEKIQRSAPWRYLGWIITKGQIRPQKVTIHTNIKTLKDAQKLLGELQWVRSIVGITNDDIAPLLPWLKGTNAEEHRVCSPDQRAALDQIALKL